MNLSLAEDAYRIVRHKCKQYGRKMLRLEAATLSNPVRSAGVTKQESEFWLEASTRCDHCPKLEFVCNNTTMPIYCPMLKPGNGIYNRADGSILPPLTLNTHHSTLNEWFYWLIDNIPFDQLGFESRGTTKWIHVSCKLDPSENRQCIFRKTF